MARRPRPGDVLLATAAVLLVACTSNEFESLANAHEHRLADERAFLRYEHLPPGRPYALRVAPHRRWDTVCGRGVCVHVARGHPPTTIVGVSGRGSP